MKFQLPPKEKHNTKPEFLDVSNIIFRDQLI